MTMPVDPSLISPNPGTPSSNEGGSGVAPVESPKEDVSKPTPSKPEPKKVTLSESTLRERLQRASASTLKKFFGTDNPKEIQDRLKKLQTLEEQKKKDDLAKMDEVTRYKTQLEEERQKRLKMEKDLKKERRTSAIKGEESRIKTIFGQHIDERYFSHVARDLADYVINQKKMTREQIAGIKEKHLQKWLSGYLKKNPAFKKGDNAPSPKTSMEPATNGKDAPRPNPNPNPAKDIRPGRPNSMTPSEVREWKRKNGYDF